MSYERELAALRQWLSTANDWLTRAAERYGALVQVRIPAISTRLFVLLSFSSLVVYSLLLRCLHLLDQRHYYILSPDSYFFHWLAGRVMAGLGPPADAIDPPNYTLHSGLAYPLAYISKALGFVFGLSSADALDLACKLVPLLLALVGLALIYLVARKMYDRWVGLFSAFAWVISVNTIVVTAAGYLDRDALAILLVTMGALLFYFARGWHFYIGNRDSGWLIAGLGILFIEVLIYAYWSFVGAALLLAVITAYFASRFFLAYMTFLQPEPDLRLRISKAAGQVNWRTFAVIVIAHILFTAVFYEQVGNWITFASNVIQSLGTDKIAEMRGLSMGDLISFGFLTIPLCIGFYLAWKKREEGTIFASCWFVILLILSLFASRIFLFTIPAACLLSGLGLKFLWDKTKQGQFRGLKKFGVIVLLCLLILHPLSTYNLGAAADGAMSPDRDWQDTMSYLKNSTPQESRVMTWWDYGYWILDLGQRRPVVDNGFYRWDRSKLHDIGIAYTTSEPDEAAEIMRKHDATYLIFSSREQFYAATLMESAGLDEYKGFDDFPPDSIYILSMSGQFEYGGGLELVHRSSPDSKVVILELIDQDSHST